MRNLVDAAGSPALELGLKTAAAEQLRGVLLAPGVASAILQTDAWDRAQKDGRDVGDQVSLRYWVGGGECYLADEMEAASGQLHFAESITLSFAC